MSDTNRRNETSHRIYDELVYPVFTIKVFLQILIGAGLLVAIIIHVAFVIGFIDADSETVQWIRLAAQTHPLKTVAYGLALTAALELAYMMFTPGLEKAITPVIYAISAATLYFIVELTTERTIEWHHFFLVMVLLGAIPLFLWIREYFLIGDRREKDD